MKKYCLMAGRLYIVFCVLLLCTMVNGQVSKNLAFDTAGLQYKTIKKGGAGYVQVTMKGTYFSRDVGKPCLPVQYYTYYVPKDSVITGVVFEGTGQEEIKLISDVLPAQHPMRTLENMPDTAFDIPDGTIYGKDAYYPANQAIVCHTDIFDGNLQMVSIEVYPMRYNPKQKKLSLNTGARIRLIAEARDNKKNYGYILINKAHNEENTSIFKSLVQNPQDVPPTNVSPAGVPVKSTLKSAPAGWSIPFYEYTVITSRALKPAFAEFINWKKRKGYNAGIVCIEDIINDPFATGDPVNSLLSDNAGKLRQYLYGVFTSGIAQKYYALLGGDYTVVPIRVNDPTYVSFTHVPSDLYFSNLTGDWVEKVIVSTITLENGISYKDTIYKDFIQYSPNIYVGRLLCNCTDDIINWTKKVLQYEQNPGNGDSSYLSKSLFTEADSISTINITVLPSIFTTKTLWKEKPFDAAAAPYFPKGNDVISALNSHYGLYSVYNHGGPVSFGTATYGNYSLGVPAPTSYPCNYGIIASKSYTNPSGSQYPETANGFEDLTNSLYPTIIFSASCLNMPFDTYKTRAGERNLGATFTVLNQGGGPAYLGNTRDGYGGTALETAFFQKISSFPQLGIAEETSKQVGPTGHYDALSHNLAGCPETPMWTATPSAFSGASVTGSGTSVTVNTGGVVADKICVMSAVNTGYFKDTTGVSSVTYTNVPQPYYVTITKKNYIPLPELAYGCIYSK